jgi:enoyl-CoA hydratase/carnithine racemase
VQAKEPGYFAAYRSLKFTRDAQGVLIVEFHTKGGPLNFTAQDHTDFVDAFYRISQDRDNKIVILTGTGGEFIPGIDFSSFGNVADPGVWSQCPDPRESFQCPRPDDRSRRRTRSRAFGVRADRERDRGE